MRIRIILALVVVVGVLVSLSSRQPAQARQVLLDEHFSGRYINPAMWTQLTGKSYQAESVNSPMSNRVDGNGLHIVVTQSHDGPYMAGGISSVKSFLYGHYDFVARLPVGDGFYPALWMRNYDNSGQMNGEIDLLEGFGSHPDSFQSTVHQWSHGLEPFFECVMVGRVTKATCGHARGLAPHDYHSAYHDFGLDWQPDHVTFLVDGKPYYTVLHGVPHVAMKLALAMATASGWDGWPDKTTPFPGALDVRSVVVTSG